MTPAQAAEVIGCHPRHVRWMIAQGKVLFDRTILQVTAKGFELVQYDISADEVERVRKVWTAKKNRNPKKKGK